jgi:hypothetical protein
VNTHDRSLRHTSAWKPRLGRHAVAWKLAPVVIAALVAGLAVGFWPAGEQDQHGLTGEQIIDQSIEAMGGPAAFEKRRTRISKGVFEAPGQGIRAKVTIWEAAPNKKYTLMDFGERGQERAGTDGRVHWQVGPQQGVRILEGEERARAVRESTFNTLLHWRDLYKEAEYLGDIELDGRTCQRVRMVPAEGAPKTVYYDSRTHLSVREDVTVKTPYAELKVEVRLGDYKRVGDVLVAHTITQRIPELKVEQRLVFDSIRDNVEIPDEQFELPQEIQALLKSESKPTGND